MPKKTKKKVAPASTASLAAELAEAVAAQRELMAKLLSLKLECDDLRKKIPPQRVVDHPNKCVNCGRFEIDHFFLKKACRPSGHASYEVKK